MVANTRRERKEAIHRRQCYFDNYISMFEYLFNNSIDIENLPSDLPKRYLLKVLREKGGIAYDRQLSIFLPFVSKGIDLYGLPQEYTLIGYDGFVITRKPSEVVILRANDIQFALEDYFEQQAGKLVDLDMAIEQNLDSIKTMTIAEVSDEASLLSITNEYQARRIGATVVYRNKNTMAGTELKASSTGAEYLVDKLQEARKIVLNETLSSIGINVANTDKKERVQGEEIRASQGYALDSINTLIDTFNYDAEMGGLAIRLKGNTSLYEANELEKKVELMGTQNENKGEENGQ